MAMGPPAIGTPAMAPRHPIHLCLFKTRNYYVRKRSGTDGKVV